MTNYWVFIVVDHKGKDSPSATQVFENRVKNKFWALNSNAHHAKKVQQGDRVVLCLAGKDYRGFAASAVLASTLQELTNELRKHIRGLPSERFTHYVKFRSIETFRQIKFLDDYIDKVSFLKDGNKPRLPQGSIIEIDENEYKILTQSD